MSADLPDIRFVIFAAPRTGSNWVCSMLNSHPEVLCHHEIFNPEGMHYALDHRGGDLDLGTPEERERAPLAVLERLWRAHFGKRAVGFKLNRGQSRAASEAVLSDARVRKVILARRNKVKTYVSEMIARRTGRWESYDLPRGQRTRPPSVKLEVEARALFEHVALNESYYAGLRGALDAAGQTYLTCAYEDLLRSRGEWARLLAFIGVSTRAELRAGTSKQNPSDLRDLVSNFAELEAALRGTELEPSLRSLED